MKSDPTQPRELSVELERANLLCIRRQFDQARALLLSLRAQYPGNADVEYLLGRIAATDTAVKAEEQEQRAFRYGMGLQNSWTRGGWWVGGAILTLYGLWNCLQGVAEVASHGLTTNVTSQIYHSRRYGGGYYTDWTRPIYVDVLYGFVITLAGMAVIAIVRRASRGAAAWEDLDTGVDDGGWFPRGWWWW